MCCLSLCVSLSLSLFFVSRDLAQTISLAMAQRLSSTLGDEELKELLKIHMSESPLKRKSFYRNASALQISNVQESFFVAVAKNQSRLNKIQLTRVLLELHKGDKSEMCEIATKICATYASVLSQRKNYVSGAKTS